MPRKPDTPCASCGQLLFTSPKSRAAPVCQPCRRAGRTQVFTCVVCSSDFTRSGKNYRPGKLPRACSMRCATAAARQALTTSGQRPCAGCEAPVASTGSKVLCSSCREMRKQEQGRQKNRERRALLRGALSEPYTLAEIAERDEYHCQLCSGPVDMSIAAPDPLSPSIDHAVPLSKGGDDTRANVQLAHRRCNTRKGVRGAQQLALVG